MCKSSRPKIVQQPEPAKPAPSPEPSPTPVQTAETDKGKVDSPAAKKAQKKKGRSSLRINRATNVAGGTGSGLNINAS
ncbi:hypothetical protein [Zooshikella sp. RANM57]|uniref:hypothetical protein n=1 Tax=Zooshikella sp. RANM57 TaxID=3425863 RepID=UPI003D6E8CBD